MPIFKKGKDQRRLGERLDTPGFNIISRVAAVSAVVIAAGACSSQTTVPPAGYFTPESGTTITDTPAVVTINNLAGKTVCYIADQSGSDPAIAEGACTAGTQLSGNTISIPVNTQGDCGSRLVKLIWDENGTPTGTTGSFTLSAPSVCISATDADGDGVNDGSDNCQYAFNPDQANPDGDQYGLVCDPFPYDGDNDNTIDADDNCPGTYNPSQDDYDSDGLGDICDPTPGNQDFDEDGIDDRSDNCNGYVNNDHNVAVEMPAGRLAYQNPLQENSDAILEGPLNIASLSANPIEIPVDGSPQGDGKFGDLCDDDDDNDTVLDTVDNCPEFSVIVFGTALVPDYAGGTPYGNTGQNPSQTDTDSDGEGDACDQTPDGQDNDGDGLGAVFDNCPNDYNPAQADLDNDGEGDICDNDDDGDGDIDSNDNCPVISNSNQADNDNDGAGDACDSDDDNDSVVDATDNCQFDANLNQEDLDGDGEGDACDSDDDGDGVDDGIDNCPMIANPGQENIYGGSSAGDACDTDVDSDGVLNTVDNCPSDSNATQDDLDGDNIGDVCDTDDDNDGVADGVDNCPLVSNVAQTNTDGAADGGDACDTDDDNDGDLDVNDNCQFTPNSNQLDTDSDGIGDACDLDNDGDGIANDLDNCPDYTGIPMPGRADQTDADGDGIGDICDPIVDNDGDGVANGTDNCIDVPNAGQANLDGDAFGDACDSDDDNDGVPDTSDSCPVDVNSGTDVDSDGIDDVCDPLIDNDGDGIANGPDNCDDDANPDQADSDGNGIGDACDTVFVKMRLKSSGKCMRAQSSGGDVENTNCNSSDTAQQWIQTSLGSGRYKYESVAYPGQCIDTYSSWGARYAHLQGCGSTNDQKWEHPYSGSNAYYPVQFKNVGHNYCVYGDGVSTPVVGNNCGYVEPDMRRYGIHNYGNFNVPSQTP